MDTGVPGSVLRLSASSTECAQLDVQLEVRLSFYWVFTEFLLSFNWVFNLAPIERFFRFSQFGCQFWRENIEISKPPSWGYYAVGRRSFDGNWIETLLAFSADRHCSAFALVTKLVAENFVPHCELQDRVMSGGGINRWSVKDSVCGAFSKLCCFRKSLLNLFGAVQFG